MVQMRLDYRLRARLDPSDVLQEAFLDIVRRVEEYAANPSMPIYIWLRYLTEQRLIALHRKHLKCKKRDAGMELHLHGGAPDVTSVLANHLLDQLSTPSSAARRQERLEQLRAALARLSETDQHVLALRHFEELTNNEVAAVLEIVPTAASNRYIRALERLRKVLTAIPDFFD